MTTPLAKSFGKTLRREEIYAQPYHDLGTFCLRTSNDSSSSTTIGSGWHSALGYRYQKSWNDKAEHPNSAVRL